MAWVSILGTGSPAGGGTPSGIGVPACHEQLEAISSAVAPITATARSQRTGDTGLPQTHCGRCPSSHALGPNRQPSSDVYPPMSTPDKVSHTLLWVAKAKRDHGVARTVDDYWYGLLSQYSGRRTQHHVAAVRKRFDRSARGPRGRNRRHDPRRIPGQVA